MGISISGRASLISFRFPPKNFSSVSMDTAEAPALAYPGTISSARALRWIHPLEGDRRLNSAMIPLEELFKASLSDRCLTVVSKLF